MVPKLKVKKIESDKEKRERINQITKLIDAEYYLVRRAAENNATHTQLYEMEKVANEKTQELVKERKELMNKINHDIESYNGDYSKFCRCGRDSFVCQSCAKVLCSTIYGERINGRNLCSNCLSKRSMSSFSMKGNPAYDLMM